MNETPLAISETENFFQRNGLQLALQVIGVIILLLNLWLATKLAPLAQNIGLVDQRVLAVENKVIGYDLDHTDLQVLKNQMSTIQSDVSEIKGDVKYLRNSR